MAVTFDSYMKKWWSGLLDRHMEDPEALADLLECLGRTMQYVSGYGVTYSRGSCPDALYDSESMADFLRGCDTAGTLYDTFIGPGRTVPDTVEGIPGGEEFFSLMLRSCGAAANNVQQSNQ